MHSYPCELTNGECQKIMIAIAIANQPRLLIADEPTNTIESTTQAQIFRLFNNLNQNHNMSIFLISHDIEIISQLVDKINVLYCGQIVESSNSRRYIQTPLPSLYSVSDQICS